MSFITADPPKPPTRDVVLSLGGMTCAACATRIEKALNQVDGVDAATVNLALERANIRFDPARTNTSGLITAVQDAGYDAGVLDVAAKPQEIKSNDGHVVLLSALLTAPLVLQMAAHTIGLNVHLAPWMELVLAAPVQFIFGARFYIGGFRALRAGAANMDVLVALGTSAAFFYSLYAITVGGHLYFESAALIITLVLFGKWLESRAKRATASAIRALMNLRPERARVLRDGIEIDLAIADVKRGDLVVVRPGDKIPTDGLIEEGQSACDEALITGESLPVEKKPGDRVIAGAINTTGQLLVRTTAVGEDTTLARIAQLVQDAQAGKAPVQRLVDRISAVFVPVIIGIALVTFAAWLATGSTFEHAFAAAVAVLVIACPCALGLATPTALVTGLGVAARHGILIKDIEALERAHGVTAVVFDKTGTLTVGAPSVTRMVTLAGDARENLSFARSIQATSTHPLAKGIVAFAPDASVWDVTGVTNHPGLGVSARIKEKDVLIGSPAFMTARNIAVPPMDGAGETIIVLAVDGAARATFSLADTVRPESKAAVAALRAHKIKTVLLSGDAAPVAARVGRDVGVDRATGGVMPEAKAKEVAALRQAGEVVAMVGDGVNDAPALSAADVGIAMGNGTDVALAAAGISLLRSNPALVPAALDISRATWRKIRSNLFWAFIYNVIGVPLAALGLLTPAIAGAAMAFSSVSVVTNSLLLKRWHPKEL